MPTMKIKKGEPGFEEKLDELQKRFSGVKKSAESETAVNANKWELSRGFVSFWSDNSDITQLIKRSRGYIIGVEDRDETVWLRVDRKGFRSCCHAFKLSRNTGGEEDA
tara:strand:+ start:5934 stop:6257 length:324 start_codon:yes stop_codon:yes gene_type:complete